MKSQCPICESMDIADIDAYDANCRECGHVFTKIAETTEAHMRVSEHNPPPLWIMGGSVAKFVRGKSPWHRDAFPEGLKHTAPDQGDRATGWYAEDWCGNDIGFFADGMAFPYDHRPNPSDQRPGAKETI